MNLRHRFRPSLEALEHRYCPSLTLQGDTLLIQGTPAAPADLSIVRTTGNHYTVTYGADSGTFQVNNIKVDLGGGVLAGKAQIDLGTSAPAAQPQSISVDDGEVSGSGVFITNLAGGTSITLGGQRLKIDGDLNVTGRTDLPVQGDAVHLAGASTVEGDVNAAGVASLTTDAATLVAGWIVDDVSGMPAGPAYRDPGGFTFQSLGEVDSYVTVQGGASNGTGLATVILGGTIFDNVTINVAGGTAFVNSTATIFEASFNFTAAANVNDAVILGGAVGADANINLGGSASTASALALVGTVNGSVTVTGQAGFVLIVTALPTGAGTWEAATVDGTLSVDLGGNGTDILVLEYGQGATIRGGVSFTGGHGRDFEIVT